MIILIKLGIFLVIATVGLGLLLIYDYGTRRMDMPQVWKGKRTLGDAMFL